MNTANAKNRTRTGDRPGGGPPREPHGGEKGLAGPVRGYIKLSNAARSFDFDFRDKVVLDIGSSTGGFTEYALEQGAKKVIAVEKGTNQMKSPLRDNPKVELHEKTDIFDFVCMPDVIVADVSFISLTKILKYAKIILPAKTLSLLLC